MRVGISLAGVSYTTTGKKRDFRKTYEDFYETLYNPLAQNHTVTVYTTTYPHELNDELLKAYRPTKHQFIPFEGSHPRSTFMHGLCLVEEEPLDFLICTRFDIKFHTPITQWNVDYSKFNFLFKEKGMWESYNFVTDTLFAFPQPYLYDMADAVETLCQDGKYASHTFMHHIYGYLLSKVATENIHFIHGDEEALSHDNRFYDLVRTES